MNNVKEWSNMLQKSCGTHNEKFLKYVRPYLNIMHETAKKYF